ncbi:MAG TPA: YabP/YqfC family sporulation protein [Candidatus Onthocola gallistercoris]|uniref:YabP/YqfC family sporulation protein n=1 Tax=Candidatus Onthocola gallistercoris TaxID=2840876 RepID=A0A9D1HEY8_9FIRM|nr:YabP/YqfC family sporulation protein [Candidatus Onthocola gallistercoris]
MLKKMISNSDALPKDISRDVSVALINGSEQIKVQNFNGILKYGSDEIVLRLKKQRMFIRGRTLDIKYYNSDEVCICGNIDSVAYVGE